MFAVLLIVDARGAQCICQGPDTMAYRASRKTRRLELFGFFWRGMVVPRRALLAAFPGARPRR